MDSGGEERERKRPGPKPENIGPRTPNLPERRSLWRCASCANILPAEVDPSGQCPHCGAPLHSCRQCTFFDPSNRYECSRPITARISNKEAKNECALFVPRTTIERETSSSRPLDARAAFENLFRK